MATNVVIPPMGESITEAVLVRWIKADGDPVQADEPICELETDKANLDLPAPASGVVHTLKSEGESVRIGETIARIDEAADDTSRAQSTSTQTTTAATRAAESRHTAREHDESTQQKTSGTESIAAGSHTPTGTGPETADADRVAGRNIPGELVEKDRDIERPLQGDRLEESANDAKRADASKRAEPLAAAAAFDTDGERRVPMSKIRHRIAERLVAAKRDTAMLTTFNEIDMTAVLELRSRYGDKFEQMHGVPLGFMSFFAAASVGALRQFPILNAQIDGNDIVYHEHVNLGIAVSTERGLVVPVLHKVETMNFGTIESEIRRVASAARKGKLSLPDLSGGTFTITNGGIFGSLLSTPILNPPQSGILGMHTIQKRPVVVNERIDIRAMMYVALTYDHRLVDGADAVRFLVRVKELIEDPSRLLLGI